MTKLQFRTSFGYRSYKFCFVMALLTFHTSTIHFLKIPASIRSNSPSCTDFFGELPGNPLGPLVDGIKMQKIIYKWVLLVTEFVTRPNIVSEKLDIQANSCYILIDKIIRMCPTFFVNMDGVCGQLLLYLFRKKTLTDQIYPLLF